MNEQETPEVEVDSTPSIPVNPGNSRNVSSDKRTTNDITDPDEANRYDGGPIPRRSQK